MRRRPLTLEVDTEVAGLTLPGVQPLTFAPAATFWAMRCEKGSMTEVNVEPVEPAVQPGYIRSFVQPTQHSRHCTQGFVGHGHGGGCAH